MSKKLSIPVKSDPTILDLTEWFLSKSPMTHKKLQKLCYYAVAWGWALMDRAIVEDSDFEAWVHGPVSKTIYNAYKSYKWNLIDSVDGVIKFPEDIRELLDSVWFTYGAKDGNELEAISHAEKPWIEARTGIPPGEPSDNKIKTEIMQEFYLSIYNGKPKTADN